MTDRIDDSTNNNNKPKGSSHRYLQHERMVEAYEYLRSHRFVETTDDVAERTGLNHSSMRSAFSRGGTYVSGRLIDRFLQAFPGIFSREWLEEGRGEMLAHGEQFCDDPFPLRSDRLKHLMEEEGLTYSSLSREAGFPSTSTIYRIIRENKRPQDATLERIIQRYPRYSRDWLFYGIGSMLTEEKPHAAGSGHPAPNELERYLADIPEEERTKSTALPYIPTQTMRFPLVQDPAVAGTLTNYGDPDPEGVRMIEVPVDREYRGKYLIFTVQGDSMDDGTTNCLAEGDRVLARSIDRSYWLDGLHTRDWLYFIFVTRTQGIVIKQVIAQDPAHGLFRLHSLNSFYPDFDLFIEEIIGIYNVIEIISRRLTV